MGVTFIEFNVFHTLDDIKIVEIFIQDHKYIMRHFTLIIDPFLVICRLKPKCALLPIGFFCKPMIYVLLTYLSHRNMQAQLDIHTYIHNT